MTDTPSTASGAPSDPHPQTGAPAEPEARWIEIVTGRYGLYTLAINIGILMWAIDNMVMAGVMPTVVADIGGMRLYSWTFALFSVGSVVGASGAGPLREILGGRIAYASAGAMFCLGLIGAACAPNMETLVGMRLCQGLGGGCVSALGYSMMATLYPERLRGRILAFTSSAWGVATSIGPGFGGIFAEYGLWREAFWSTTPLSLLFIFMALKVIPDSRNGTQSTSFPFGRLSLIGTAVISLSASSQVDMIWLRAIFVVLSAILVIAAFKIDGVATRPMFPRLALRIRSETGALYWLLVLNSMTVVFYATFQTLQLQVLHNVPPIVAAYLFMLSSLGWSLAALVVATWKGRMELAGVLLGALTLLAGTIGLSYFVISGPVYWIAICIAASGCGVGFQNNILLQRAIRSVPAHEKGTAGASVQATRTMGVAFGAAAAGLVAVAGGLNSETPTYETAAHAMRWVYMGDVVIAVIALIITIGLIVTTKERAHRS